jgi:hypothetical protein
LVASSIVTVLAAAMMASAAAATMLESVMVSSVMSHVREAWNSGDVEVVSTCCNWAQQGNAVV